MLVLALAWAVSLSRPATGQQAMARARAAATIRPLSGKLTDQMISYPNVGNVQRVTPPAATVLVFFSAATAPGARSMAAEIAQADRNNRELAQQVLFIGIDLQRPTLSAAQGTQISTALGLVKLANWQMGSISAAVLTSWRAQLGVGPLAQVSGWLVVTGRNGGLHWLLIEPPSPALIGPYAQLDASYALAIALR